MLVRLFLFQRLILTGITAEGDRVAIEAQGYAKLKNGKTYENLYHFLFIGKSPSSGLSPDQFMASK